MHTIRYRQIPENAIIDVIVERLIDDYKYRVSIYEEYDAHIIELTDINILKSNDRRWLEEYVKQFYKKNVYFGSMTLGNFYRLERYKDFCYNKLILKALNDLNIS